jgi:hypothetical protein
MSLSCTMILTRTDVHDLPGVHRFAPRRHLAVPVHVAERQRQPLAAAPGPSSLPHRQERGRKNGR